ncbi:hypothetical protein Aduo_012382 [Ancylostoma duodenale]
MSRRRLECAKPLSVEEASLKERPEWNDTLRGILVALVKDRRALWDARFRTTKEKTMFYFREIADILSNQDSRMNEWSVLEKWCWMVEMYMRTVERPSFDWRFKGAMAFHNEFAANGVHSLTPEILSDLTLLYAETEAEYEQVKTELNKKLRKGSATYRAEMMIYHKMNPSMSDTGGTRPKVTAKRGRPRGSSSTTAEQLLSGLAKSGKEVVEGKAIPLLTSNGKPINIKEENSDTLSDKGGVFEGPTIASVLEEKLKMTMDGDTIQPHSLSVTWTTEMVDQLIQCVKEIPALWHYDHPQYCNSTMRKKYFSQIAEKLRSLPGGASLNGDQISAKWSALRDSFELQLKNMKQEGSADGEQNQRLLFLTPEVMSACRFDDLTRGSEVVTTSTAEIPTDVQSQIHKILGYVPEPIKSKEHEDVPAKKAKFGPSSTSQNVVKTHIELDSIPHVQQVVSTWVPPREDSLDTVLQSYSSTPPTATAQVTVKNDIAHILRNPSMLLLLRSVTIAGTTISSFMGKFCIERTASGRMIEETARELETKHSELAYRLQKDINDVIFKYQLESLRHK